MLRRTAPDEVIGPRWTTIACPLRRKDGAPGQHHAGQPLPSEPARTPAITTMDNTCPLRRAGLKDNQTAIPTGTGRGGAEGEPPTVPA